MKTGVFIICKTYVAYFRVYPFMFQIQTWIYTTWCWFHINVGLSCIMIFERNIFKDFSLFCVCKITTPVVATPFLQRSWFVQTYINTYFGCFNTKFIKSIFFKCQHFFNSSLYTIKERQGDLIFYKLVSPKSRSVLCWLNFAQ